MSLFVGDAEWCFHSLRQLGKGELRSYNSLCFAKVMLPGDIGDLANVLLGF